MRLLHTMLRVGDLDKSIAFYSEVLGMAELRRKDYPDGEFTLAFMGYGDEKENTVLELTHNWGTSSYDLGTAYGHIAIEVDDVYVTRYSLLFLDIALAHESSSYKRLLL